MAESIPSLISRLGTAARTILGRDARGIPPPSAISQQYGVTALLNPGESSKSYGYNVWPRRADLSVAMEIAGIELKLQTVNDAGEAKPVKSHRAPRY